MTKLILKHKKQINLILLIKIVSGNILTGVQ